MGRRRNVSLPFATFWAIRVYKRETFTCKVELYGGLSELAELLSLQPRTLPLRLITEEQDTYGCREKGASFSQIQLLPLVKSRVPSFGLSRTCSHRIYLLISSLLSSKAVCLYTKRASVSGCFCTAASHAVDV